VYEIFVFIVDPGTCYLCHVVLFCTTSMHDAIRVKGFAL